MLSGCSYYFIVLIRRYRQGLAILAFISRSSLPLPERYESGILTGNSNGNGQGLKSGADTGNTIDTFKPVDSTKDTTKDTSNQSPATSRPPALTPSGDRVNATFVTLARNSDVWDIAKSIRQVEDRFNRNYHYDWVFLNDQPFDDTFKKITTALVSGTTHYGLIPKEHWSYPEWIDQDKAKKVREDMKERKIIYGDSESYRHMCRYESGFFFRHELMLNYEYYWRVEPSIQLFCDISFDPFRFMKENNKKYSFVISLYEYFETIPTLWDSVQKFMSANPQHIAEDNSMGFLSDDGGKTYNKCHFVRFLFPYSFFFPFNHVNVG